MRGTWLSIEKARARPAGIKMNSSESWSMKEYKGGGMVCTKIHLYSVVSLTLGLAC